MARRPRRRFEFLGIAVALVLGRDGGSVESLRVVLEDVPNEALGGVLEDFRDRALEGVLDGSLGGVPDSLVGDVPSEIFQLRLFLVVWGRECVGVGVLGAILDLGLSRT